MSKEYADSISIARDVTHAVKPKYIHIDTILILFLPELSIEIDIERTHTNGT